MASTCSSSITEVELRRGQLCALKLCDSTDVGSCNHHNCRQMPPSPLKVPGSFCSVPATLASYQYSLCLLELPQTEAHSVSSSIVHTSVQNVLKFSHAVSVMSSFLMSVTGDSIVWTSTTCLSSHQLLHVLVLMNKAGVNMYIRVLGWRHFFSRSLRGWQ